MKDNPLQRWPSLRPFLIGRSGDIYLYRWFIIPRNKWFNIYLHRFQRSDDMRALHDHPWRWNASLLVWGIYVEHTPHSIKLHQAPAFIIRRGPSPHRLELLDGKPAWTIFITGQKFREWGFLCSKGWRHWTVFCSDDESGPKPGIPGRGCD